tara:strand:- start:99 stop:350 length:252 start_codon:yes stop_codon:yes gene_type:complete
MMKNKIRNLDCLNLCKEKDVSCPNTDCRLWINYEKEYNCANESIYQNDKLTLREVADRLGISFVRVKQIEDKAINKIKKYFTD